MTEKSKIIYTPSEKKESTTKKDSSTGPIATKTKLPGGGTQTVTSSGKVTIRDSKGNIVRVYQGDPEEVKQHLTTTKAETEAIIAEQKAEQEAIQARTAARAGYAQEVAATAEKAGITTARAWFEAEREGRIEKTKEGGYIFTGPTKEAKPVKEEYGVTQAIRQKGFELIEKGKAIREEPGLKGVKGKGMVLGGAIIGAVGRAGKPAEQAVYAWEHAPREGKPMTEKQAREYYLGGGKEAEAASISAGQFSTGFFIGAPMTTYKPSPILYEKPAVIGAKTTTKVETLGTELRATTKYTGEIVAGERYFEITGATTEKGVVGLRTGKLSKAPITETKGVTGYVVKEVEPGFMETEFGIRQSMPGSTEYLDTYYAFAPTKGWSVEGIGTRKGMMIIRKVSEKGTPTTLRIKGEPSAELGKVEPVGKPKPFVEYGRTEFIGETGDFRGLTLSKEATTVTRGKTLLEIRGEGFEPKIEIKSPDMTVMYGKEVPKATMIYEADVMSLREFDIISERRNIREALLTEAGKKPLPTEERFTLLPREEVIRRKGAARLAGIETEPEYAGTKIEPPSPPGARQKTVLTTKQAMVGRPPEEWTPSGGISAVKMIVETEATPRTSLIPPTHKLSIGEELKIRGGEKISVMPTLRIGEEPRMRTGTIPRTEAIPKISTKPRTTTEAITKTEIEALPKTKQELKMEYFKPSPGFTFPTPPPPISPPKPGIIFGIPLFGGETGRGLGGKPKPQPKAYKPSVAAIGLGIKGKPSKAGIITGLGIRPIPTTTPKTSTKKKKKKK